MLLFIAPLQQNGRRVCSHQAAIVSPSNEIDAAEEVFHDDFRKQLVRFPTSTTAIVASEMLMRGVQYTIEHAYLKWPECLSFLSEGCVTSSTNPS